MARGKSNIGMYVAIGIGGFIGIILLDQYVFKGQLRIASHFNMLIGKIKQQFGIGAGPITPAPVTDPGVAKDLANPPQAFPKVGTDAEQIAMGEEMGLESLEDEPETAAMARRRAMRAYY